MTACRSNTGPTHSGQSLQDETPEHGGSPRGSVECCSAVALILQRYSATAFNGQSTALQRSTSANSATAFNGHATVLQLSTGSPQRYSAHRAAHSTNCMLQRYSVQRAVYSATAFNERLQRYSVQRAKHSATALQRYSIQHCQCLLLLCSVLNRVQWLHWHCTPGT